MITLDTWIVSDTHFKHANIVKYCNRPLNHNEVISDNWHRIVGADDPVLHLGDLMIWYKDDLIKEAKEIAIDLPGKKQIIRGNHDKLSKSEFAALGFEEIDEFIQEFNGKRVLFSHYPDTERGHLWDLNIHGHIHNNREEKWSNKHINVSIEVMAYRPVRLRDILNESR